MLTIKYNKLFQKTLQKFAEELRKSQDKSFLDKKYSIFYPVIGKDYLANKNLLVVGQATFDWQPVWNIKKVSSGSEKIIKESIDYSETTNEECPLEWINKHWSDWGIYRSVFWNLTYKVVEKKYNKTDENWNNIIAWSNLMKIAPIYSNPKGEEINAQVDLCAELFKMELDELQPVNVLIITNLEGWAEPILRKSTIHFKIENGNYIQATAKYKKTNIIVTSRQRAMEHLPFIEEISKALK